ncbi:hypothetical protein NQ314_001518 [Rhamnusium bicolor]|uniref:Uncharacterized protein n=1 Tax=Rhamnusium bicolor TaxID=1586634 RepID=A0AAV8ZTY8_9CUCU|nr:hypothetical protein NQ314_001518 [Rhamnusium bicolor]
MKFECLCVRFAKKTGHWNNFEVSITTKKGKRPKSKDDTEGTITEAEKIRQSLDEIRKSTNELRGLDEETLSLILRKFKFPVRTNLIS